MVLLISFVVLCISFTLSLLAVLFLSLFSSFILSLSLSYFHISALPTDSIPLPQDNSSQQRTGSSVWQPEPRGNKNHNRAMSKEVAIYVSAFIGMTGIMGVFALVIHRKHQRQLQQNLAHIQIIHDRRQQAIGKLKKKCKQLTSLIQFDGVRQIVSFETSADCHGTIANEMSDVKLRHRPPHHLSSWPVLLTQTFVIISAFRFEPAAVLC